MAIKLNPSISNQRNNGHSPRRVFFSLFCERSVPQLGVRTMLDVTARAGFINAMRIDVSPGRTDWSRDAAVSKFIELSSDPKDTFVMFDNDHIHDPFTIERLLQWDKPVVSALAFRRSAPFYPCVFVRNKAGILMHPTEWDAGLIQANHVGFSAVAIQRWVFESLIAHGFDFPFFQYVYPKFNSNILVDGKLPPHAKLGEGYQPQSEDIFFCKNCEDAGIEMFCDMSLIAPHITDGVIDEKTWQGWLKEHPAANVEELQIRIARTVQEAAGVVG